MEAGYTDKGFKLVTPENCITFKVGDEVTLPCHLSPKTSAVAMEIRWFMATDCIYRYKNGDVTIRKDYEGRVSVNTQELQRGDVSLSLRGIRGEEEGRYTCQVIRGEHQEEIKVWVLKHKHAAAGVWAQEGDRLAELYGQPEITAKEREEMEDSVQSLGLKLVVPDHCVGFNKGDDVTLHCHLSPETSAVAMEIRWFRKTDCIYLYKNGHVTVREGYEGRVSVNTQELQRGDASLTLRRSRWEDVGVYTCQVIRGEHQQKEGRVELRIGRAAVGIPEITAEERNRMKESVQSLALHAWRKTTDELTEKITQLEEKEKTLKEKDRQLEERDRQLEEKEKTLKEKDRQLEERDRQLEEKEKTLKEKDTEMQKMNRLLHERDKEIEESEKHSQEKDKQLEMKDKLLEGKELQIKDGEKNFKEKMKLLEESKERLMEMEKMLEDKNKQMEKIKQQLEEKNKEIQNTKQQLDEKNREMEKMTKQLEERNKLLQKRDVELETMTKRERERESLLENMTERERERESLLENMTKRERERESLLENMTEREREREALLENRTSEVETSKRQLESLETELQDRNRQLQDLRSQLEGKDIQLEPEERYKDAFAQPAPGTAAPDLEPKIELEFSLERERFTPQLQDSSSPAYKTLADKVATALDKVYVKKFGSRFIRTVIKGFRPESVCVRTELLFKDKDCVPETQTVTDTLDQAVSSNSPDVAGLGIRASSLKAEYPDLPCRRRWSKDQPPDIKPESPSTQPSSVRAAIVQQFNLGFRLQQTFTPELADNCSPEFQNLATKVLTVLNKTYTATFGSRFIRSQISGFREGSVVVDSVLTFKCEDTGLDSAIVISTLKEAVAARSLDVAGLAVISSSIVAERQGNVTEIILPEPQTTASVSKETEETELNRKLGEKDKENLHLKDRLESLEKEHQDLRIQLQEKGRELGKRDKQLEKRDKQLEEKNRQLEEKNRQLEERDTQLEERDTQLEERDTQLEERDTQLEERDKLLEEREGEHMCDPDPPHSRRRHSMNEPPELEEQPTNSSAETHQDGCCLIS